MSGKTGTPGGGTPPAAPPAPNAPASPPPANPPAPPPHAAPPADDKTKQVAPPSGAPEKYELKPHAETLVTAAHLEKIVSISKERGFSNDQAQSVLDVVHESLASLRQSQVDEYQKTREGWRKESETKFGDKFKETEQLSQRGTAWIIKAIPEAKEFLEDTWLGDHPVSVQILALIGKEFANDSHVPAPTPPEAKAQKTDAEVMFPSMVKPKA